MQRFQFYANDMMNAKKREIAAPLRFWLLVTLGRPKGERKSKTLLEGEGRDTKHVIMTVPEK